MYKNSARDPTKAIKKLGTQSVRVSVLGALGNENRGSTRQNSNSPRFLMQMSRFKGAATGGLNSLKSSQVSNNLKVSLRSN